MIIKYDICNVSQVLVSLEYNFLSLQAQLGKQLLRSATAPGRWLDTCSLHNALEELLTYLSLYVTSDSKKIVNGLVISVLSVVIVAFWLGFLIAVCRHLVTSITSDVLIDFIWLLDGLSNLSGLSDSDCSFDRVSSIGFSVSRVRVLIGILITFCII